MLSNKPLNKNIQFLITANYQRMVSFEQAAFLTSEPSFKEFYFAKAEESEINIKQLYLMLNMNSPSSPEMAVLENLKSDSMLSNIFHGKKSTIKILQSVKAIEKTIAQWYKTTLKEIKDLPAEIVSPIEEQYKSLNNAQLQMEYL